MKRYYPKEIVFSPKGGEKDTKKEKIIIILDLHSTSKSRMRSHIQRHLYTLRHKEYMIEK